MTWIIINAINGVGIYRHTISMTDYMVYYIILHIGYKDQCREKNRIIY